MKEQTEVSVTDGEHAGARGTLIAVDSFTAMVQTSDGVILVAVKHIAELGAAESEDA